jgi:hypothetical protein
MLNLRFMKALQIKAKTAVQELQNCYYLKSAELESNRLTATRTGTSHSWIHSSTSAYYDQQHQSLIDRVEFSLTMIEERQAEIRKEQRQRATVVKSSNTKQTCVTSDIAQRIMVSWYDRNIEHPYPSYEAAKVMAEAGSISVDQVKKWFSNRRLRLGHTKHITQIAKRRKRTRSIEHDDLFSGATSWD